MQIGSFEYKHDGRNVFGDLYEAENILPTTKPGEKIFRYETYASKAGGMKPLVKINIERKLLYHVNHDTGVFETRGIKCQYVHIGADLNIPLTISV